MVPLVFIYCYWLWAATLLYLMGANPYPPLASLVSAALFTFVYTNSIGVPLDRMIAINLFEISMVYFCYKTWVGRGRQPYNALPELALFAIYLLFLSANNETFHSIYFVKNWNFQQQFRGNVADYVRNRFSLS